ncbi:hypothetical protein NC652_008760 [Populus alba x Populus x berolinensis]|nr:hypothetical protein NC652_008760 [Populus alba x Populus x berolinensis]
MAGRHILLKKPCFAPLGSRNLELYLVFLEKTQNRQQRTFIQTRTLLEAMDSSGAKRVMCTQPLKGKKGARLGDTIIVPWNAIACSPSNYLLQQKPYFAPGFRHVFHIVPLFSMLQRAHPPFASPTLPLNLIDGSNQFNG